MLTPFEEIFEEYKERRDEDSPKMPDLRDIYTHDKLLEIANHFKQEASDFPVEDFVSQVEADDWKGLTLRQRHKRLAEVAFTCLDRPYPQVAQILRRMTDHAHGFSYLFLPDMVALYGLEAPEISMEALGVLTTGSSAEFAIRPFLDQDFEGTFTQMQAWASSDNEHHRRLASEGLRPKLPWGKKVAAISEHQAEIFSLLETLKADPSLYVRKSVANHLNDWSKTHPDQVLDLLEKWQGSSTETDWICKQAARTLLKASHPRALALFGYGQLSLQEHAFAVSQKQVTQGDQLTVSYAVQLDKEDRSSKVRLELQIGFITKTGKVSYKTFILKDTSLTPGERLQGQWTYDWEDKTIRKHQNGPHLLRFVVNGQVLAEAVVDVVGF